MTKDRLLELYKKFGKTEDIKNIRTLRNYKDEDIDIILNSKYPSIMMNIILNYEYKLLKDDKRKEIIDIVNNAKSKSIAEYIYYLVRSKTVISSGLTVDLAKIICNSEENSAKYAIDTALNANVLLNKDAIELVKIVASSKTESQASCSSNIAQNIEVLMSEEAIELTKLTSLTEDIEKRKTIYHISVNKDVTSSGLALKLATLASKIDSTDILKLTITIACNKILEKHNRSAYYIAKILSVETYEEALNVFNEAQKLTNYIKEQEANMKNDNSFFWTLFKNNSEKAIALLKLRIGSNEVINQYTRVRKK